MHAATQCNMCSIPLSVISPAESRAIITHCNHRNVSRSGLAVLATQGCAEGRARHVPALRSIQGEIPVEDRLAHKRCDEGGDCEKVPNGNRAESEPPAEAASMMPMVAPERLARNRRFRPGATEEGTDLADLHIAEPMPSTPVARFQPQRTASSTPAPAPPPTGSPQFREEPRLTITPITMPGSVITFGSRWVRGRFRRAR